MIGGDSINIAKSADLLSSRRLLEHADSAAVLVTQDKWTRLTALQGAIYELDAYFEENWSINRDRLSGIWHKIERELACSVGRLREALLNDILVYQGFEWSLRREFELPNLGEYYYYKTCDVRLLRRLLEEDEQDRCRARLGAWNLYDIISEVADDFDDLELDIENFNGNRLLLGVGRNGGKRELSSYARLAANLERAIERSLLFLHRSRNERYPLLLALERLAQLRGLLVRWSQQPGELDYLWQRCSLSGGLRRSLVGSDAYRRGKCESSPRYLQEGGWFELPC